MKTPSKFKKVISCFVISAFIILGIPVPAQAVTPQGTSPVEDERAEVAVGEVQVTPGGGGSSPGQGSLGGMMAGDMSLSTADASPEPIVAIEVIVDRNLGTQAHERRVRLEREGDGSDAQLYVVYTGYDGAEQRLAVQSYRQWRRGATVLDVTLSGGQKLKFRRWSNRFGRYSEIQTYDTHNRLTGVEKQDYHKNTGELVLNAKRTIEYHQFPRMTRSNRNRIKSEDREVQYLQDGQVVSTLIHSRTFDTRRRKISESVQIHKVDGSKAHFILAKQGNRWRWTLKYQGKDDAQFRELAITHFTFRTYRNWAASPAVLKFRTSTANQGVPVRNYAVNVRSNTIQLNLPEPPAPPEPVFPPSAELLERLQAGPITMNIAGIGPGEAKFLLQIRKHDNGTVSAKIPGFSGGDFGNIMHAEGPRVVERDEARSYEKQEIVIYLETNRKVVLTNDFRTTYNAKYRTTNRYSNVDMTFYSPDHTTVYQKKSYRYRGYNNLSHTLKNLAVERTTTAGYISANLSFSNRRPLYRLIRMHKHSDPGNGYGFGESRSATLKFNNKGELKTYQMGPLPSWYMPGNYDVRPINQMAAEVLAAPSI